MRSKLLTRAVCALALLFAASPVLAQENQPGDACTTAGQLVRSGGIEIPGGHMLVCNGTNWISILDYEDSGRTLFQVDYDPATCTALKQGRLRYTSTDDSWQYCNGTAWSVFRGGGLAFRGAMVRKTVNQSISATTSTYLTYETEDYDTDGFHDNVTNNGRLTIPAASGITHVRLVGNVRTATASAMNVMMWFTQNGSAIASQAQGSGWTNATFQMVSPVIPVNDGDYFELGVYFTAARDVLVHQYTWFAIQVVGADGFTDNIWTAGTGDDIYYDSGTTPRVGIGTAAPAAILDVAGEIKFSSSGLACTAARDGTVRYVSSGASPPWEYCDGSAWVNFKQPRCQDDDTGECYSQVPRSNDDPNFIAANIKCNVNILGVTGTLGGGPPDAFAFTDQTDVALSTLITSNIVQITGLCTAPTITISGTGSPEYRICNDGTCSSTPAYGSAPGTINNNQYVQLHLTSSAALNTMRSATLTIDTGSDQWDVTTLFWTAIAADKMGSCGLKSDGTAWCWGDGTDGALGYGGTAQQLTPVQLSEPGPWAAITPGGTHGCGLKSDNTAWCWGFGGDGALGNGGILNQLNPVQLSEPGPWAVINPGGKLSCGIKSDGTAWCWGEGKDGALGYGGILPQLDPVPVSGAGPWMAINPGGPHSCGLKSDGTAWCWGFGGDGALGNGGILDQLTPMQISEPGPWTAISAGGGKHSCGIKTDGTAWCWGLGASGQLGYGGTATQLSPVQISEPGPWTAIDGGKDHSCGLKTDGTTWCWGVGFAGQLGYGGTAQQNNPVQISEPGPWTAVGTGKDHSCGIKTDGTAWCWGLGLGGELGNGGILNQLDPVQVSN